MRFSEAMKKYEEGHKIRSVLWGDGQYISREEWLTAFLDVQEIKSVWEIYEEPKAEINPHLCSAQTDNDLYSCIQIEDKLCLNSKSGLIRILFCPWCGFTLEKK